jgi:hypothetical protein
MQLKQTREQRVPADIRHTRILRFLNEVHCDTARDRHMSGARGHTSTNAASLP